VKGCSKRPQWVSAQPGRQRTSMQFEVKITHPAMTTFMAVNYGNCCHILLVHRFVCELSSCYFLEVTEISGQSFMGQLPHCPPLGYVFDSVYYKTCTVFTLTSTAFRRELRVIFTFAVHVNITFIRDAGDDESTDVKTLK